MSIHILVDGAVLARSRFACSPAVEVCAALHSRGAPDPTPPGVLHHTRRWNHRARARLEATDLALLHAFCPTNHPYTPDFLTPLPSGPRATIEEAVEAIARTPEDLVDYHLDVGLDGRPARPEVLAQFTSEEAYRAWRRPTPDALARVITAGPRAVAEEAARVVEAYFTVALAQDWPLVCSVLEADVAHRAEQISATGWGAMLHDLGDLTWTGEELTVHRPYEGVVDWADGVLLVPSVAHGGPVQFSAERPLDPVLIYPATGTAVLWSGEQHEHRPDDVDGLIGRGRHAILASLDQPRTTRDLSRIDGRSESTISYHLGVLNRAGLVDKRRTGRGVTYWRTTLAESLVAGGPARMGQRAQHLG
ncbi:MAG: DUF5937 family protein [Janibacter sp.]